MRRTATSLHIFLTLLLLAGLLFGAVGQNLVQALGGNLAPTSVTFNLHIPVTSPTNADTLTFRVTFNDEVTAVDALDFMVKSTVYSTELTVTPFSSTIYDVKMFGGNLESYNGDVSLDFSEGAEIKDMSDNIIDLAVLPATKQKYVVDNINPMVTSFLALGPSNPATTQPISYTLAFSEPINPASFTPDDITQAGTASHPVWTITDTGNHQNFDLTVTASGNGTIIPILTAGRVQDPAGNGNELFMKECNVPENDLDHCVTLVDNGNPTVTILQTAGQLDPAPTQPIYFKITFSEIIDRDSFTEDDLEMDTTIPGLAHITSWNIKDTANPRVFSLVVWADTNGNIVPILPASRVFDLTGNGNEASASNCSSPEPNNCVTLNDTTKPSITIEQHPNQADPASTLPIRFNVSFTEPINTEDFTSDVIQEIGTSGKIVWKIIDSGNRKDFTLFALQATAGTVIPVIPPGKVRDLVGLYNTGSTSVDNSVNYVPAATTPTATAIPYKTVVITEVAWMGSAASSSDEWIELFNTTGAPISMDGWHLRSFRYNGKDFSLNLDITFTASDIIYPRTNNDPKSDSGYFLLERGFDANDDNAVKGIQADKIYTGSTSLLSDSGEIILLCSRQNMDEGSCNINQKNQVVDFVNGSLTSGGGINPWPAGKGSSLFGSMERKNLISDEDTNWYTHPAGNPRYGHDRNWDGTTASKNRINGTPKHPNWSFDVTATPRPTITPTRTPTRVPITTTALLVLNEVLARAGSDWNNDGKVDVFDEFIEVVNSGTVNVVLSNYKLDDGLNVGSAPFSLPNQTLKPGEIAVFYGSQTGIRLEDSGDTVRLLRASNNSAVDAVTYPIAKSVDASVCRYTDAYGSWLTNCFPTPGRPNALSGELRPSTSGGSLIPVCFLPDSAPDELVLAECGIERGGLWNHNYWDSFPGEGSQLWQVDPHDKWLVIYQ